MWENASVSENVSWKHLDGVNPASQSIVLLLYFTYTLELMSCCIMWSSWDDHTKKKSTSKAGKDDGDAGSHEVSTHSLYSMRLAINSLFFSSHPHDVHLSSHELTRCQKWLYSCSCCCNFWSLECTPASLAVKEKERDDWLTGGMLLLILILSWWWPPKKRSRKEFQFLLITTRISGGFFEE